jgi:3-oxoacyl-[acyl-carrier protein] reductase
MPVAYGLYDLAGRVALVTGAGVGIGRATALQLARCGAKIGVHFNSSEPDAAATLAEIRALGGDGVLLQADLTDETAANSVVDRCVAEWGRLDILINNAGAPLERTQLEHCSTELWRRVFDVNVTSAFFVSRRAIPALRASGRGAIVNNLSLSVQTGGGGGAGPYAAAKGALEVMTRTLARELAPAVRVNAVMPGVIATRHHEVFSTPEHMEGYRKQTLLQRNGEADEVAAVITFLASDAASFMTGTVTDINGGRYMR